MCGTMWLLPPLIFVIIISSPCSANFERYEVLKELARGVDVLPDRVQATEDCSFLPRMFHELVPAQVELLHLIGCFESRIQVNLTENSREFRHLAMSVIQLTLTDGELTDIPSLFDYTSLQFQAVHFLIAFPNLLQVAFSNNKIQKIELDTFSYNPQLRGIYLDSNEIESIQNGAFQKLIHLTTLDLSKNKLFEVPALLPLSLTSLDLSDNQLERVAPQTIEENVKRLETLNLCGNNLKPKISLIHLELGGLKSLCLGSAGIGFPQQKNEMWDFKLLNLTLESDKNLHWTLNATSLSAIRKLLRLRELNLGYFKIESLEFLHPLSKLEVLRLNNISLTQSTPLPPMFFINKINLKIVDLDQSPKLTTVLVPFLAKLPRLEKVSLRRTELKTFPSYPFVTADTIQLDLSMNPLYCTGDFQWILDQCKIRDNSSSIAGTSNSNCRNSSISSTSNSSTSGNNSILLSADITCCETPYRLEGVELRLVDLFGGLEKNSTLTTDLTTTDQDLVTGGYRLFNFFKKAG